MHSCFTCVIVEIQFYLDNKLCDTCTNNNKKITITVLVNSAAVHIVVLLVDFPYNYVRKLYNYHLPCK